MHGLIVGLVGQSAADLDGEADAKTRGPEVPAAKQAVVIPAAAPEADPGVGVETETGNQRDVDFRRRDLPAAGGVGFADAEWPAHEAGRVGDFMQCELSPRSDPGKTKTPFPAPVAGVDQGDEIRFVRHSRVEQHHPPGSPEDPAGG